MAKTFDWFGTSRDAALVVAWLVDEGATLVGGAPIRFAGEAEGKELVVQFPSIGPVEFWPTVIAMPRVGDNSSRAKRTILARIDQESHPGVLKIDSGRSAVAGVKLPELRDGRYWVSGRVWFPTANLQKTFPELNRIRQRLGRFLDRHPAVYDNRTGSDESGFSGQLCMSGALRKVVALPDAYELLRNGAFMVDQLASSTRYADCQRRLQSGGDDAAT